MSGRGFKRLELGSEGIPTSPKTSETGFGSSLLGNGGRGGGKGSEKAADSDETGVGTEPLIVRLITDIRTPKHCPIGTQVTYRSITDGGLSPHLAQERSGLGPYRRLRGLSEREIHTLGSSERGNMP